jgi:hypothetical protein
MQMRSALSYEAIAKRAGLAGRSSVQRYFDPDFDGPLSLSVCQKLTKGFEGTDVQPGEIWALIDMPAPNGVPLGYAPIDRDLERSVPVYGTALGAPLDFGGIAVEQTELHQNDVIAFFARQPAKPRESNILTRAFSFTGRLAKLPFISYVQKIIRQCTFLC